jgi:hypothetical protein
MYPRQSVARVRRKRHDLRAAWPRRLAVSLLVLAVAATALLEAGASAKSPDGVSVRMCGYTNATYGKSALYPWQMSCSAARKVVAGASNRHAHVIDFAPGVDGGAVRIDGKYWVCTGQMGYYNCGYPYRPKTVRGGQGYKGPFTKDVAYVTCSLAGSAGCPVTSQFTQPPG